MIGDGSETKHFVHVSDVARANAAAFAADATDVAVNISGPQPVTTLEIVRLVTELCGKDLDARARRARSGQGAAYLRRRLALDHARPRRAIGWRPQVDMREGIRRLIAWREASGN